MPRDTPQIPSWGTHRRMEARLSAPPRGHGRRPLDGRQTQWASVLTAGREFQDFTIFGLKRPIVRADTGISGGPRLRGDADVILPQVRLDAAASPAAPKLNVTSVSVETRFRPARVALPSRCPRRALSTDPISVYRSAWVSPASAASRRLHCSPVEDYCPPILSWWGTGHNCITRGFHARCEVTGDLCRSSRGPLHI